ncbi:MAG: hypothetical protein KAS67_04485 [Thermoplasmata archaeon]|nr:hypothetical protein [Thermoplasmata archaeon]
MKDDNELEMKRKLKLLLWSISAGVVVAFFFSSNFLKFATGFAPGSEILFISPLFCGFILGLLTTMDELYHSVFASIILTVSAVILITMSLFAPIIFGVSGDFVDLYYVFVIQNITISIVLIFPVSLVTTIIGKVTGEYAFLSHIYKNERAILRRDTVKWYQMLEEATPESVELKPIGWKPPEEPESEMDDTTAAEPEVVVEPEAEPALNQE